MRMMQRMKRFQPIVPTTAKTRAEEEAHCDEDPTTTTTTNTTTIRTISPPPPLLPITTTTTTSISNHTNNHAGAVQHSTIDMDAASWDVVVSEMNHHTSILLPTKNNHQPISTNSSSGRRGYRNHHHHVYDAAPSRNDNAVTSSTERTTTTTAIAAAVSSAGSDHTTTTSTVSDYYVGWPGTQDAYGQTIPWQQQPAISTTTTTTTTNHDGTTIPPKHHAAVIATTTDTNMKNTIRTMKMKHAATGTTTTTTTPTTKKAMNDSTATTTINTSANTTTTDTSFQSFFNDHPHCTNATTTTTTANTFDDDDDDDVITVVAMDVPPVTSNQSHHRHSEMEFFRGAQMADYQSQLVSNDDDMDDDDDDDWTDRTKVRPQPQQQHHVHFLQEPIPLTRSKESIAMSLNQQRQPPPPLPSSSSLTGASAHTKQITTSRCDTKQPTTIAPAPAATGNGIATTGTSIMKGYRGFIEKTKDIPSLMDDYSVADDSATTTTNHNMDNNNHHEPCTLRTTNTNYTTDFYKNNNSNNNNDTETYVSDVFDGISVFSNNFNNSNSDNLNSRKSTDMTKSLSLQQYHLRDKLPHVPRVSYPYETTKDNGNDDDDEDDDDDDQLGSYYGGQQYDNYNNKQSNNASTGISRKKTGTGSITSNTSFQLVTIPGMNITTIQTLDGDYNNRYTNSLCSNNSDVVADDTKSCTNTNSTTMTPIPSFQTMISSGRKHDNALHGIYGNIGQQRQQQSQQRSSTTTAALQQHQQQKQSNLYNTSDQKSDSGSSSCSGSGNDDPGLYDDTYGDCYLSEYYIQPSIMKKVLLQYRTISDQCTAKAASRQHHHLPNEQQYELLVDERKAFALFEMRSRIMEKDIERQLERRGGSFVVDDIVTTSYHRTAHRIRDAVIVSKAWRDGATISDVINTAHLSRRQQYSYAIPRRQPPSQQKRQTRGIDTVSWEIVRWLDDTDFIQYRCPSLGSRHMHGFEMFTIGDCQSILLKLTNERCDELRRELNVATAMQITAEEIMKEEEYDGNNDSNVDGMMTEAEMTFLSAMEQVKTISKQLVSAEKAFALVRDRIRNLISRYETMLLKIEAGSYAGASSIVSYESSYYSEYDHKQYMKEERVWAKRAMRAEIRAEIAAREALLAKQHAHKVQAEKMREIDALRKKLDELQSENSVISGIERERNALTSIMSQQQRTNPDQSNKNKASDTSREKLDGVKQRFRDRMVEKKRQSAAANVSSSSSLMSEAVVQQQQGRAPLHPSSMYHSNNSNNNSIVGKRRNVVPPSAQHQAKQELLWSAGEEMFQQMVFYERSLESVVADNTT